MDLQNIMNVATTAVRLERRGQRQHHLSKVFSIAAILLVCPLFGYGQVTSDVSKQGTIEITHVDDVPAAIEPDALAVRILPDAPVVKPASTACQQGLRKPCALLGGQVYRPSSLTQPDRSWTQAIRHPPILIVSSVLVASFIADYKSTRYCVDRGLGHEGNPLLGQSRAQELSVGLAATGISIWGIGKLKQQGDGRSALFAGYAVTALHAFAAYHNAAVCGQ